MKAPTAIPTAASSEVPKRLWQRLQRDDDGGDSSEMVGQWLENSSEQWVHQKI